MLLRVLTNIILIAMSINMPFWFTVLFFVIIAYFFSNPFEIIFYGVLLDILFMASSSSLSLPIYTTFALVIYFGFEKIKPRLRTSNI